MKYQEDEIKAYCKEQGLNLIHIFRDEGISGAKLNDEVLEIDRVGLQEMLAHLLSVQKCGGAEHKPIMAVRYCESADSKRVEEYASALEVLKGTVLNGAVAMTTPETLAAINFLYDFFFKLFSPP